MSISCLYQYKHVVGKHAISKVYLHQSLSLTESMVIQKYHLSVLQLTPTVCSINNVDWWFIDQHYWNIGVSLGISSEVLENIQRSVVGKNIMAREDCIKSMLLEWLKHKIGTGNKKRTWGTICTAVANGCSHVEALSILEQGMYRL